ncbi:kinase-like domain-containing protein [Mycena floridula]|nr:kinase-like domain-containing protein [Mycena floridula]
MEDYAAAMAFLDKEAKVVGIDVREDSGCQICWSQWHLMSSGETLAWEEQGAFDDPQGWINDCKIACIDSSKVICKLPLGLISVYLTAVDAGLVEYSDLTLDINNSTAMKTMSKYLAWKPIIIKSFAKFPEGTLNLDRIHRIIRLDTLTICAHLLNVIKDRDDYKQFTSESQPLSEAQESLNLLLQLLDLDDLPSKVRACFLKAIAHLCRKTGLYPECLRLNGLQQIGGRVDGGGFGDVSVGLLQGVKVSLKTPRVAQRDLKRLLKDFSREIIIWSQLSHPNVLPFYGIYYLNDRGTFRACIVSPWMENGNLLQFLNEIPDESVNRSCLILDIACGLQYLHQQSVIHGDLKALNVLVTPSLRACIMDFGLSTVAASQMTSSASSNSAGTPAWQAPEILEYHGRNTQRSDMYAFACVCYEVFTRKRPFCEIVNFTDMAIVLKVMKGERPMRPASSKLNDTVWNCMDDCWKHNPDERPTAAEIVRRLSVMPELSGLDRPNSDTEWDESFARRLRSSLRENPLLPTIEQLQMLLPGAWRSSTPISTVLDTESSDELSDVDSSGSDLGSMDSDDKNLSTVDTDSEESTMPLKCNRLIFNESFMRHGDHWD